MLAKVRLDAAIGGARFFFELSVVDELSLVHKEPRESQGV